MPYVAVSVYSYSLKAEYHPCFVKIILMKNGNFIFALRKRLFCIAKPTFSQRQIEFIIFSLNYLYKIEDLL